MKIWRRKKREGGRIPKDAGGGTGKGKGRRQGERDRARREARDVARTWSQRQRSRSRSRSRPSPRPPADDDESVSACASQSIRGPDGVDRYTSYHEPPETYFDDSVVESRFEDDECGAGPGGRRDDRHAYATEHAPSRYYGDGTTQSSRGILKNGPRDEAPAGAVEEARGSVENGVPQPTEGMPNNDQLGRGRRRRRKDRAKEGRGSPGEEEGRCDGLVVCLREGADVFADLWRMGREDQDWVPPTVTVDRRHAWTEDEAELRTVHSPTDFRSVASPAEFLSVSSPFDGEGPVLGGAAPDGSAAASRPDLEPGVLPLGYEGRDLLEC